MVRIVVVLVCALVAVPSAQESLADAARRKTFDLILDTYVRDGEVYYRALKSDRAKLDGYLNLLGAAAIDKLSREERLAFWINAYNAAVMKTVIDHYPIHGRAADYPANSIRQIPGAFDKLAHRVGGRSVTLDQIEQTILTEFHDPRVYLALGRGALGGGRLRSEAFTPQRVEAQLTEVANECPSRMQCVAVDRENGVIQASPIFSWREREFVAAYADKAPRVFNERSPIERAVLAFILPKLLTIEKEFVDKNTFRVAFSTFDWSLNDLTGRGGR